MTVEQRIDEPSDRFPIGMRVLAVDDDPTCLLLLETLLRRCQYHVTTTSQAVKALKMLRENKDKFDLVISDVHMPDMDGFKLLELVGLEMDLPVIMLSGNDDPRLVMKGITHGACDYLLKPIRLEELKNIWQHVIRRKKLDSKGQNTSDKLHHGTAEGGQEQTGMGSSDQIGKLNKKRKDQDEDEEDERDENAQDNEDPSAQKKPRVVWSVDLHRKFVAAVHQLGIDKAVPKRILELMNVENLTRENVASHLQKYRLYLKRISLVERQQANMIAAYGSTDSSYLRMDSLNGLGNYNTLSGSQFQNAAFRSFPHNGMLGRLNTPAGLGIRGLSSSSSSGMVQLAHGQNSSYPNSGPGKMQPVLLQGNQNVSILQGMPLSFEFDQLEDNKIITRGGEQSTAGDNLTVFPVSSGLPDTKVTIGGSSNPLLGVPNNPLILQGHVSETQSRGGFGNQSSVTIASFGSQVSSHLPDHVRCSDNWSSAVQPSGIQSNSFSLNDPFKQATLSSSSFRDNMSMVRQQLIGNHIHDVSSVSSVPTRLQDSITDLQCQTASMTGHIAQHMSCTPEQVWDNQKQNMPHRSNVMCDSINTSTATHGHMGPLGQSLDPKIPSCHRNMDFNLIGQPNFDDPLHMLHNEVGNSAMETTVQSMQGKPQGSYTYNNFGSLEDLVSAVMKQEQDKMMGMEGDLGCDNFTLGTCM